ncbi:MAG TPA: MFS transporter [Ktedonobacteraceae bacterium]
MSRPLPRLEYKEKDTSISEGVWSENYRRLTLGLILIMLGPAFETLAVATILPKIVADLGGLSFYGWSFSAYMLATLVGLILAGDEADQRGPALPFIIGVVSFVLGLVLAGTAPSMIVFVLSRAVQGFGAGILVSVTYACVGQGYPEQLKPRMVAILASAWVVPGLIGPALAGIIAELFGWRWVFLGLVFVLPLGSGLVLPALKKLTLSKEVRVPRSLDIRRLLATAGLVAGAGLTLAGLQAQSIPLALALILPGLPIGIQSLRYVLPPGTLRVKAGLPAAIACIGLLSVAFFGAEAFLPLTLITIRGQNTIIAGIALTAATLSWTAGSWLQAHFAPKQGRRMLVLIGLLIVAVGIAGIAIILIPGIPALVAIVAWGVGGLGMGLAYSTISLVVLETAPKDQVGSASASMELSSVLGTALGTGLGGVIIAFAAGTGRSPNWGIAVIDTLVIAVIGLACLTAIRLPGKPPQVEAK